MLFGAGVLCTPPFPRDVFFRLLPPFVHPPIRVGNSETTPSTQEWQATPPSESAAPGDLIGTQRHFLPRNSPFVSSFLHYS